MALQISFILLETALKMGKEGNPSTSYFVATFANNLGKKYYEQKINCIITLKDIIASSSFTPEVRNLARTFSDLSVLKDKHSLSEFIRFRNMVFSAFQSKSKVMVEFLI